MDLSAIIFVVLALAWAVYLIPKALKHHDELASDRLVEGHSDKVRILARKKRTVVTETVETVEAPVEVSAPVAAVRAPSLPTRAAARRAAQRRRRVLGKIGLALAQDGRAAEATEVLTELRAGTEAVVSISAARPRL